MAGEKKKKLTKEQKEMLVGMALCALVMITSIVLSILSFLVWGAPSIGITFLYSAIAGIGGTVFIAYKKAKLEQGNPAR